MPQVPQVPTCPSVWVPKCPSAMSAQVLKCPSSAQVFRVSKGPSGALVPKCPWVSMECPWSALSVPNFHLRGLRAKNVWKITRNGLVNSFIEFLKIYQNTYSYMTLIIFSFLGNKMYKFYHILLARFNHSNGFQKLSLNIL